MFANTQVAHISLTALLSQTCSCTTTLLGRYGGSWGWSLEEVLVTATVLHLVIQPHWCCDHFLSVGGSLYLFSCLVVLNWNVFQAAMMCPCLVETVPSGCVSTSHSRLFVFVFIFVCVCVGLSLTGSHLMCGDFLYSGHTVMCTLSYLFIKECE